MRVALVGAGRVGDNGRIELLAELPAQFRNSSFRVFGKLLRGGAVLHGTYCFARVILKIAQQAFQLLFHLADFDLLLFAPFRGKVCSLPLQFLLARLQALAFAFRFAQISMQLVEKLPYIARLSSQSRASAFDDGRIQAQTACNVNAGRRSGHSHFQLVGRLQCGLVKAHRGIQHTRRVRGVDLE